MDCEPDVAPFFPSRLVFRAVEVGSRLWGVSHVSLCLACFVLCCFKYGYLGYLGLVRVVLSCREGGELKALRVGNISFRWSRDGFEASVLSDLVLSFLACDALINSWFGAFLFFLCLWL